MSEPDTQHPFQIFFDKKLHVMAIVRRRDHADDFGANHEAQHWKRVEVPELEDDIKRALGGDEGILRMIQAQDRANG